MPDDSTNPTPPPPTPPPPAPARPPAPPKPHGCFFRLFVAMVVLLLVLGGLLVVAQWALQNTDYARKIALPIVEQKLGLRLNAKGLKVSLLGYTELTDVEAGLPLDDQYFLHVPEIDVRHANLFQILLDRAVTLDDVTVKGPTVDVVQDKDGQWNLLRVVAILGRLGGSNDPRPTATSGGVPRLPAVHLVNGTIRVADLAGHRATVAPLDVVGEPDHLLKWNYNLTAGPAGAELLKVDGVVAPGGDWQHRLTVAVGHLDPLARAFGVDSTYAAVVAARWEGQLTDGKVGGRLTLQDVFAADVPGTGDVSVTGAIDVATGGGGASPAGPAPASAVAAASPAPLVTLVPVNLQLVAGKVPAVGVTAGAVVYDGGGLHARGLRVNALGGAANLDLTADPKTQNVDLSAHWSGLTLAAGISQAGSLTASLRQPFPNHPLIRLEVDDQGAIGGTPVAAAKGGGRWDAAFQVTGQGVAWTSIDWVLAVPRLKVDTGGTTYDLSGISAAVQQRPTTIDLLGLTLPPNAGATTTVAVGAPVAGDPSSASAATPTARSAVPASAGTSPYGLSFAASAHVDLPDQAKGRVLKWTTTVNGGVLASYQGSPLPVTLSLDATGDDTLYTLKKFAVSAADANLNADGQYQAGAPKPVALHVALTQTPRLDPDAPIQGNFGGDFKIVGLLFDVDPLEAVATPATEPAATEPAATEPATGPTSTAPASAPVPPPTTVAPTAPAAVPTTAPAVRHKRFRPYLTTTGDLRTSELVVFGKPIGDIDIKLVGDVTSPHPPKTQNGPDAANAPPPPPQVHVHVRSTDFSLFQAPWDLSVDYPNEDGAAELNLSTSHLPLDVLDRAATGAATSPVQGQLASAHWRVTAAGLGLGKIDLTSEYHLTGLAAGGLTVDAVDARASFHDGVAKLDPVVAYNGDGEADLSVVYALAQPSRVRTRVAVKNWPFPLGSALGGTTEARANANVDLGVDLRIKGAVGSATAAVDVLLHPAVGGVRAPVQTLAHAQLAADVRGRTMDLTDLSGRVLNGTFQGQAQIDLGKPLEAAGRLEWAGVDAGALGPITGNKALDDLGGKFSGTVTIAPSRDPRPLEPVRIDVNVAAADAHFRSVMLGDPNRLLMTHAVVYANVDRVVLDHSDIYLGGGIVHLWGRVGRSLGSQQVLVDYNDMSLDQLAHLAPGQTTGPVPGVVSGTFRVIRSGPGLNAITGGGHADLIAADLVNLKAIRKLYDLLQASNGGLQPVGQGGVDFALEAGTVRVSSFRFYNRGIDAKGLLTVGPVDPTDVMATRLGGQVVGTERLFKNSRLPLIGDFDSTFSALQGSLTALNISGTLAAPTVGQAAAADLGNGLRELVVGDAQQDASGN